VARNSVISHSVQKTVCNVVAISALDWKTQLRWCLPYQSYCQVLLDLGNFWLKPTQSIGENGPKKPRSTFVVYMQISNDYNHFLFTKWCCTNNSQYCLP